MNNVNQSQLKKIAKANGKHFASIYAPMHRSGKKVQQNAIRWKNAIRETRQQLARRGVEDELIDSILKPAESRLDDDNFWQHQSDGLAFFVSEEFSESFRVSAGFEAQVYVGNEFQITPLLQAANHEHECYILAVSPKRVRLLKMNANEIVDLDPDELPENMRDALNIDEYVSTLQFHSTAKSGGEAMHHGQGGGGADEKKKDLLQYFQRLNDALDAYFGIEDAPLIFAGVEFLFPIFKEACHYRNLIDEPIGGNPDEMSPDELKQQAAPIVDSMLAKRQSSAIEQYAEKAHTDWASDDPLEICRAAAIGQVDTLLIAEGFTCPATRTVDGRFELANENSPEATDIANLAAIETIRNGGLAISTGQGEMQNEKQIAAIYRSPASQYASETTIRN